LGTKNRQELSGQFPGIPKTLFSLGLVGPPFGIRGFVKIKSFSGETDHFSLLDKVTLRSSEKEETREVAEIAFSGKTLLMRFAGIENPETAILLKGAEIIAAREYAAPLKEGEFYVEDLKGLEVVNSEGEVLGHIANIVEGGGGNLAEILLLSGGIRLVPFRNEFFGDVDIQSGKIILNETWILDQ